MNHKKNALYKQKYIPFLWSHFKYLKFTLLALVASERLFRVNSSEPPGPHSTDCFEQIPKIKRPDEWATTKCYIVHFCNKKHWKLINKIKSQMVKYPLDHH